MLNAAMKKWATGVAATIFVGAVGIISSQSLSRVSPVAHADPVGIKYNGPAGCSAVACHGAKKEQADGATRHNENFHWQEKDQHAKAFSGESGLVTDKAKAIAKALGIADATKADRCLVCHSISGISVGADVKRVALKAGELQKGSPDEGVSCDACHGPSGKYLEAHAQKGWTAGKRKELGSAKLFTELGLFDTKDVKFRANTCLSCHLKIDADMVAGGHPELPFELDTYSQGEWVHWRDHGHWFTTKAWAMGQVVSLREAAVQVAERAKAKAKPELIQDAYKTLLGHAITSRQIALVVDAGSKDAIDAQLKAVAAAIAADPSGPALELGKVAEALADKLNAKDMDEASTGALLKGVAAQGEIAAPLGFKPAEQYTLSLKSLWGTTAKEKDVKDTANMDKIDALYEPMGDKATYDAAKFGAAAKTTAGLFPGGAALPLPDGVK